MEKEGKMINLLDDYNKKQKKILNMSHKQMNRMLRKIHRLYRLPFIHGDDIFVPDVFEMNERYLNNLLYKGKITIKNWRTLNKFNLLEYRNN